MTSNSQLKQQNFDLKQENRQLLDLRLALMADNRRLEFERNNAELRADILDQGMTHALKERDEARTWARRMKRERDEALELVEGLKEVVYNWEHCE